MKPVLLLLALAVTTCTSWEGHGVVVDREHRPAWEEHDTYCAMYDDKMNCTVHLPRTIHHDATWWLRVNDDEGVGHDVQVTEEMFHRCGVNRTYDTTTRVCGENV